jgi:FtsZ-binding cell division protein ZapB
MALQRENGQLRRDNLRFASRLTALEGKIETLLSSRQRAL